MNTPLDPIGPAACAWPSWFCKSKDLVLTLLLWGYFTLGFVVLFGPFYILGAVCAPRRHGFYEGLNHYFYRGFFGLCRLLIPSHKWRIDDAVGALRSSVIVCNHVSYIDSILMISLFRRHTTIVKDRLFHMPVMGWVLKLSGYLPSVTEGPLAELMLRRMETITADLAAGTNLFIFPEGTRSRDGRIGPFNPGAFKIARLCRAPLKVLFIRNTNRLFKPDKFLFNTCTANTITVELIAELTPPYDSDNFSIQILMEEVRQLMEARTSLAR